MSAEKRFELRPLAVPPAIGSTLGIVWKVVEWVEGVDFLLSISNTQLAAVLAFLIGPFGWVFVVGCLVWLTTTFRRELSPTRPSSTIVMAVTAIPAFALGAIVVASNSNEAALITSYAREQSACAAVVDSRRLTKYQENYALHLVCGPTDSSVDRMRDSRILFSAPFTITGGGVAMTVPISDAARQQFSKFGQTWFRAVLIPDGRDMAGIKTLRDVQSNDGIVLDQIAATGPNVRLPQPPPEAKPNP